jgi:hypothetical protein
MSDELELICDDDGLAVIGDPEVVNAFLAAEGLESQDLGLGRLRPGLATGAGAAQAASEAWAQSGRWVKLTKESAADVKKFGLTPSKTPGASHAMIRQGGSIKSWIQVDTRAAAQLTNPALITGAAGIMAQLAMQQAMNEVVDYLETIDEKLDDVLRSQKDAALAPMIGTGFLIEEAIAIRDQRGRVDEITWSKLHGAPQAIAETQAYALRQLDALAQKLERKASIGDLADAVREVETHVQEWLAVLARSFELQDGIAVLELDRVLDAAPDELDAHRLGLKKARQDRLDRISTCTQRILSRIEATAQTANAKVLTHPGKAPSVVRACTDASVAVTTFHDTLGIDHAHEATAARRWSEAVRESGDKALTAGSKALTTGAERAEVAKRVGDDAAARAKSASAKVASRARGLRWRGGDE